MLKLKKSQYKLSANKLSNNQLQQKDGKSGNTFANSLYAQQLQKQNKVNKDKQKQNQLLVILIVCIGILSVFAITASFLGYDSFGSQKQITAIVLIANSDEQQILKSIQSYKIKTKQLKNIIIGSRSADRIIAQKLKISKIGDIFFTNYNLFEMKFLQQLVQKVKTEYFFLTTTQWELQNQNFLLYSKNMLTQFPQVSQILPNQMEKLKRGLSLLNKIGFSFSPGLHRKRDFTNLIRNLKSAESLVLNYDLQTKASNILSLYGLQAIIVHSFGIKRLQKSESFDTKQIISQNIKPINQSPQKQESQQQQQQKIPNNRQGQKKLQTIGDFAVRIQNLIKQSPKIFQVEKLKNKFLQLPFCLLVFQSSQYTKTQILYSIRKQSYSNYQVISNQEQINYHTNLKVLKTKCKQNSVIMFVSNPLKPNALHYLNGVHQENVAWLTYTKTNQALQVFSFFFRIYELLGKNDFLNTNSNYLKNNDIKIQALGLLEICLDSSKFVSIQHVLKFQDKAYFHVLKQDGEIQNRTAYTKIHRLSQDMQIDTQHFAAIKIGVPYMQGSPRASLTNKNMMRASDRQQEWYLPENHTIAALQRLDYDQKFNISKYTQIKNQVPFCITVLSHNNIQNDRFIKVIKTIVMQQYQNYHIVFIDDNSTDANMNATIQYFKKINFPKDRLTFIQNKQRNYATYNILNAAYNFCKEDDIQLLVDGDDEFIGKYAFQVMNSAYQQKQDLWMAYSNYKTNYYGYGRSVAFTFQLEHLINGKRLFISSIGPIRTWRVKLLYNIPIAHHKMADGNWLDTVYDDALQHPLLQLSTVKKTRYINEILYEYNIKYGDNDDSTAAKIAHRTNTYNHILGLKPLSALKTLQGSTKDQDVQKQLQRDNNTKYTRLTNW